MWKCGRCRQQFIVKVETIFEGSHTPVAGGMAAPIFPMPRGYNNPEGARRQPARARLRALKIGGRGGLVTGPSMGAGRGKWQEGPTPGL